MARRGEIAIDGIVHVQKVAYLFAISRNVERLSIAVAGLQRPQTKPTDPALVVGGKLATSIDCRVAEDDRVQPVHSRVIEHVLIGSSFRAAIRRMETERRGLVDTVWKIRQRVPSRLLDHTCIAQVSVDLLAG